LTQEDLAENSGASRRAIQDFESGLRWPRESTLGNLEHALGWDRGYLSEYSARVDSQEVNGGGDVGERWIQEMPYLLSADREHFLRVYRARRDDDAVLRLAELERNREGARTHPDADVASHLVAMIDRQIADLRSRGYETIPVDTES
jgi:transcriptional regulator with XRE-family HTH domain